MHNEGYEWFRLLFDPSAHRCLKRVGCSPKLGGWPISRQKRSWVAYPCFCSVCRVVLDAVSWFIPTYSVKRFELIVWTLQNPPLVPTQTWRRTPNHKIIDYYVVLSVATFKRPTLFPRLVHINMMSDVYPGFLSPLWALIVSVRGNFWVYCGMPGSMILNDPQ